MLIIDVTKMIYVCNFCDQNYMCKRNNVNVVQAREVLYKQIYQRKLFSVWYLPRAILSVILADSAGPSIVLFTTPTTTARTMNAASDSIAGFDKTAAKVGRK